MAAPATAPSRSDPVTHDSPPESSPSFLVISGSAPPTTPVSYPNRKPPSAASSETQRTARFFPDVSCLMKFGMSAPTRLSVLVRIPPDTQRTRMAIVQSSLRRDPQPPGKPPARDRSPHEPGDPVSRDQAAGLVRSDRECPVAARLSCRTAGSRRLCTQHQASAIGQP
jgi:hypothetical protein